MPGHHRVPQLGTEYRPGLGVWGGMSEDEWRALSVATPARKPVPGFTVPQSSAAPAHVGAALAKQQHQPFLRPTGTRSTTHRKHVAASCIPNEPSNSAETKVRTICRPRLSDFQAETLQTKPVVVHDDIEPTRRAFRLNRRLTLPPPPGRTHARSRSAPAGDHHDQRRGVVGV